jgi:CRISPR/Cas system CMR subunit Cmr4 (Cas7 group RAMP superfamily)
MDIVKRVKRNGIAEIEAFPHDVLLYILDSAEEIERLREERDKLKEALRSLIALTALKLEGKE